MVKGRLPGQTGAIFHFCLLRRISGEGKGLKDSAVAVPPGPVNLNDPVRGALGYYLVLDNRGRTD